MQTPAAIIKSLKKQKDTGLSFEIEGEVWQDVDDKEFKEILVQLKNQVKLTHLRISTIDLELKEVTELFLTATKIQSLKLFSIDLGNTLLSDVNSDEDFSATVEETLNKQFEAFLLTLKSFNKPLSLMISDLDFTQISVDRSRKFFDALGKCKFLQEVSMVSNEIFMGEAEICKAFATFLGETCCRTINLSATFMDQMETDLSKEISKALAQNRNLKKVKLSANQFGENSEVFEDFLVALRNNGSVQTLDLSSNELGSFTIQDPSMTALGQLIEHGSIESLNLSANGLNEACLILGPALQRSNTLKFLDFSQNSMGEMTVHEFDSVETAELKMATETKTAFESLMCGIVGNNINKLEELALVNCDLDRLNQAQATRLGLALSSNRNFKTLNVGNNNIFKELSVCQPLLSEIQTLPALRFLKLKRCGLGNAPKKCFEVVINLLTENRTLESLDLSSNKLNSLKNKAFNQLLGAIAEHPTLETVNLRGNKLGKQSQKALEKLCRAKPNLFRLDIGANNFSSKIISSVKKMLKNNVLIVQLTAAKGLAAPKPGLNKSVLAFPAAIGIKILEFMMGASQYNKTFVARTFLNTLKLKKLRAVPTIPVSTQGCSAAVVSQPSSKKQRTELSLSTLTLTHAAQSASANSGGNAMDFSPLWDLARTAESGESTESSESLSTPHNKQLIKKSEFR